MPEGSIGSLLLRESIRRPPDDPSEAEEAERHYWPVRALKLVARLPHLYETWIGAGHTIPNGDPAKPFAEGTKLCGAIVGAPVALAESFRRCELSPEKTVHLHALYPIHLDEMEFKLEHGADALFDKMAARKVSEIVDPKRRSVLARRFWIV